MLNRVAGCSCHSVLMVGRTGSVGVACCINVDSWPVLFLSADSSLCSCKYNVSVSACRVPSARHLVDGQVSCKGGGTVLYTRCCVQTTYSWSACSTWTCLPGSKDAAVDTAGVDGQTALHPAARFGHSTVVQLLLGAQAAADATAGNWTALHMAAHYGHAPVLQTLIAAQAAVDAAGAYGWAALHRAAIKGHIAAPGCDTHHLQCSSLLTQPLNLEALPWFGVGSPPPPRGAVWLSAHVNPYPCLDCETE